MDLSTLINSLVDKERNEKFSQSEQLSLGEFILKLEEIPNKNKEVIFDFGNYRPGDFDSWRGIYKEIAIEFIEDGFTTTENLLNKAKEAIGKTYEGYKGGNFIMSRQTPIWVANYGHSIINNYKDIEGASVAIIDIKDEEKVIIVTNAMKSY